MSVNPADIAKLATAANAAKYQGSGTGGWGTALKYLGALAAPIAGAQQTGIVPAFLSALDGVGQVKNESAYNQYLRTVAEAEKAQRIARNQNEAGLFKQATGQEILHPDSGFDTGYAGGLVPDIRKNNANSAYRQLASGENVTLDNPYADYGSLPEKLFERANNINDANATLHRLPAFYGVPIPGMDESGVIPGQTVNTPAGPMTMQKDAPFQAGASKQQVITPGESNQYGIPDLQVLVNARQNEQTDRRGNFSNDTTRQHYQRSDSESTRHNKADEGIGRTNASANMIRANKYQPGGGGGSQPNEAAMAYAAYKNGLISREQYAQTLGAKGPSVKTLTPSVVKALGEYKQTYNSESGGLFKNSGAANRALQAHNMLARQYGQPEILPFGGQSNGNLKSSASNFDAWQKSKLK